MTLDELLILLRPYKGQFSIQNGVLIRHKLRAKPYFGKSYKLCPLACLAEDRSKIPPGRMPDYVDFLQILGKDNRALIEQIIRSADAENGQYRKELMEALL